MHILKGKFNSESFHWSTLRCHKCRNHVGWKYIPSQDPICRPFYGLDRSKIVLVKGKKCPDDENTENSPHLFRNDPIRIGRVNSM